MINNAARHGTERPLFLFACGFTLSCLCCALIFSNIMDLPKEIMLVAVLICAVALMIKKGKAFLTVPFLGFGLGLAFFMLMQQTVYLPTQEYIGTTAEIEFTVVENPIASPRYSTAVGEITLIDGKKTDIKAQLYLQDATPNNIIPGDCFKADFAIKAASREQERRFLQEEIFISAKQISALERLETKSGSVRFVPNKIAKLASESFDKALPKEQAALMRAIVIGDKTAISPQQKRDITASGTSHITAVSGLHVSLLLALIIAIFGYSAGSVIALPMIAIYVLVVGAPPSAIRAAIMICFGIGAMMTTRQKDSLTAIGGAIIFLILLNPWSLLDIGLQLSFASVLGLTLFMPPMKKVVSKHFPKNKLSNRIIDFFLNSFVSTIAVLVFTLPILCLYFTKVSVVTMIGNLLILPVISIVIACGIIIPILFYFANALVFPVAVLAKYVLMYIGKVQNIISNADNSTVPGQNIFLIIFAFSLLALGLIFIDRKKGGGKIFASAIVIGISCLAFAWVENKVYVDVSILNYGGSATLMARSKENVSAFATGEFLTDEYYSVAQRQMDKWCSGEIESLIQLGIKSVPPIDQIGKSWLKINEMAVPSAFDGKAYVGENMLQYCESGGKNYSWGSAEWKNADGNFVGSIALNGGKFLLGCGIKPRNMLDCIRENSLTADYMVVDEKYGYDIEALAEICKATGIKELICMRTVFGEGASLKDAFDGKITYVEEYEGLDFKMMAQNRGIK